MFILLKEWYEETEVLALSDDLDRLKNYGPIQGELRSAWMRKDGDWVANTSHPSTAFRIIDRLVLS